MNLPNIDLRRRIDWCAFPGPSGIRIVEQGKGSDGEPQTMDPNARFLRFQILVVSTGPRFY